MRFGITRRFGLRIPASEAAGAAARRELRVGSPDADGPLAAQQAPTPSRPGGGCSLRRLVIKPMVVIGNAVVPRVNCGQVIARCNPSILPRIQPSSMLHFSRDIRVHSLRILLGGPWLSSAPRGVESIQGGSCLQLTTPPVHNLSGAQHRLLGWSRQDGSMQNRLTILTETGTCSQPIEPSCLMQEGSQSYDRLDSRDRHQFIWRSGRSTPRDTDCSPSPEPDHPAGFSPSFGWFCRYATALPYRSPP